MAIQYLPVSWLTYLDHTRILAESILSQKSKVNQIVAISRGGLTLGHLLSDLLRIPIATLTIQSYANFVEHGELAITEPLSIEIKNKHVLVVDDVSDSGKTLVRTKHYLSQFDPASITIATMFYKPHSILRPDYFTDTTSKWILFPYEPTEVILATTKAMEKEGKTKAAIQAFLKRLGYTDTQIQFVRKYHLTSR